MNADIHAIIARQRADDRANQARMLEANRKSRSALSSMLDEMLAICREFREAERLADIRMKGYPLEHDRSRELGGDGAWHIIDWDSNDPPPFHLYISCLYVEITYNPFKETWGYKSSFRGPFFTRDEIMQKFCSDFAKWIIDSYPALLESSD
jgi:hypothetical protein